MDENKKRGTKMKKITIDDVIEFVNKNEFIDEEEDKKQIILQSVGASLSNNISDIIESLLDMYNYQIGNDE